MMLVIRDVEQFPANDITLFNIKAISLSSIDFTCTKVISIKLETWDVMYILLI